MAEKKTHFGRAGEFFAMSELLLRNWNVAVPVVDIGDDVFVIDDNDKTTWRLQVKSADASSEAGPQIKATFSGILRAQLRTAQPIELLFMFLVRVPRAWRMLIIPRVDLLRFREAYVEGGKPHGGGSGRPPVGDAAAKTDSMSLTVTFDGANASAWNADLGGYLDRWPEQLPIVQGGPGTTEPRSASGAAATTGPAETPDPSLDPERSPPLAVPGAPQ